MSLYFSYIWLSRRQHLLGLKYYKILVIFDHTDGSTSWGYKFILS